MFPIFSSLIRTGHKIRYRYRQGSRNADASFRLRRHQPLAGHGNALGLSGIRARNASQFCLFLHSHVLALRSLSRGPMRLTPVRGSFQVHLMSHTIAFGITFDARARTRRICAQFFLQGCFNKNVIVKLCSELAVPEKDYSAHFRCVQPG
jgi:hypothetical protein